jgi:integrase
MCILKIKDFHLLKIESFYHSKIVRKCFGKATLKSLKNKVKHFNMIDSAIKYLKKKQVIYTGLLISKTFQDREARLITKLLFTSGLDVGDIKKLRWENLTIIENILLLNNKDETRLGIASQLFIQDLLKSNNCEGYIFPKHKDTSTSIITKNINNTLLLNSIQLDLNNPVDCDWLTNNFEETIYIPKDSKDAFKKYIKNKITIKGEEYIKNKEFKKLLEIKSLI